jgi:hypothetical protein
MIQISSKNVWGKTLEAQRTDLWRVDLSQVYHNAVNPTGVTITQAYSDLQANFPDAYYLDVYTHKLDIPENLINSEKVISGSKPLNLPGYNAAIGAIRIDLFHECTSGTSSKVYSLMKAWQMLALAGQSKFGQTPDLPLASYTSKPNCFADLLVQFLGGTHWSNANLDLAGIMDNFQVGTQLRLIGCWCGEVQLGELDYENGKSVMSISAQVYPQAIVPISSNSG